MPGTDRLREIQETELEALRAIFGNDFEQIHIRSAAKALATPFEFRIRIRSEEIELCELVNLSLRIRLPKHYPNTKPTLVLEDSVGLTDQQMRLLLDALNEKATELIGTEMLYELASMAAGYITEHHHVVLPSRDTSLIEERLTRASEAEKLQRLAAQAEKDRQTALKADQDLELARQIQRDLDARTMMWKQEREKEAAANTTTEKKSSMSGRLSYGSIESEQVISVKSSSQQTIFVQRGPEITDSRCLGRVFDGHITEGIPVRLQIVEPRGRYYTTAQGAKNLRKVMTDLESLQDLSHPNLHNIYGSKLHDGILTIVSEPLPATSLRDVLNQCGTLRLDKALEYLLQISDGLGTIHQAHMVHRGLKPHNIFLCLPTDLLVKPSIKIAHTSWFQRLCDLCRSNPFGPLPVEPHIPDSWICRGKYFTLDRTSTAVHERAQVEINICRFTYSEEIEDPLGYKRSRDLYDLGVTFAQMLFGEVWLQFPTPALCIEGIPKGYPSICQDILTSLLLHPRKASAERIVSHIEAFHSLEQSPKPMISAPAPYQQTMRHIEPSLNTSLPAQRGIFWQPQASAFLSRYRTDFEEVEFLGKGGFGEVVKARNKLDNRFYAVKKIRLPPDPKEESKILREVTILSRYHACWIETGPEATSVSGSELESNTTTSDYKMSERNKLQTQHSSNADEDVVQNSIDSDDSSSQDIEDGEDNTTIHDFDLRLDDLDFLSCTDRDTSLPSIRFADPRCSTSVRIDLISEREEEDGSQSSEEEELSGELPKLAILQRTLFMQMEFVDSLTLREAIDQGLEEEQVWRIARQIISGMAYFTSLNVIHRDLKPSNIFLDAKGDVRIGDFGLAVNQGAVEYDGSTEASPLDSDITFGVGTLLYIPPETMGGKRQGIKFLDKIDMYSFGIVLFEMFHKMGTLHERVEVIRDLRKPEVIFPSNWKEGPNSNKTRIVQWCLAHNPELRPSPTELLKRSDLLPPQPEEENLEALARMISLPENHALFRPYLASLFQQPLHERIRRDFTYDFHAANETRQAMDNPFRMIVCEHLVKKFRQRGAVNIDSPVLLPYTDYDNSKLVKLLDSEGTVVLLPFDATIPFARTVARDNSLTRLKRFSLAPVYRPNEAGGQPDSFSVASYDIVSPTRTLAAEAEILQLIDEILRSLPMMASYEHVLSHNKLWEALSSEIVNTRCRTKLQKMLELYNPLDASSWSDLSAELVGAGISRASLEFIRRSFDVCGSLTYVSRHLRIISSGLPIAPAIHEAIADLEEVVNLARILGMSGEILVWPLMAPQYHSDESNGVYFKTWTVHKRKILASGGRFDGLVQKLVPPGEQHASRSCLVSVSVAVSALSLQVGRGVQNTSTPLGARWSPRRCDVYVLSFTPNLLKERLLVIKELWAAGISADLMYEGDWQSASPEIMLQKCRREAIIYAVIVKAHPHKDQVVKVRNMIQRTEVEVPLHELSVWLEDALQEHHKGTTANLKSSVSALTQSRSSGKGKVSWNANHGPIEPPSSSRDYQLILPADATRKMKHKTFETINESITKMSETPILAIELEDTPFKNLFTDLSWIDSSESYRKNILDYVPSNRKDYALEFRRLFLELARKTADIVVRISSTLKMELCRQNWVPCSLISSWK
ncbi:hypothetical protein CROQUDRAFT_92989 [Cronartium quercuum f. sp. fusiforme G11]|uniref:non-specific serine/threonine protein kinase n=1 Tax=Cronartium quercuum f. sp. fusiforme G11 TaxID=708437 RepID=A0A9P6NL90_9BASI|nr:hypothetical protein CROQUDRAFT_92989 [Cronartium quercuum f. sp. fusiforme G11]